MKTLCAIACLASLSGCYYVDYTHPQTGATTSIQQLGYPMLGNTTVKFTAAGDVEIQRDKSDTYSSIDTGIGAIERLAPLAANLAGQQAQNRQALDLIEAQRPPAPRPAATPRPTASFPAFDVLPMPTVTIPAIPGP